MKRALYLLILPILLLSACKPPLPPMDEPLKEGIYGTYVIEAALMDCFPEGTVGEDEGSTYNCESSAVEIFTGSAIIGIDKYSPAVSPVFLANGERIMEGNMTNPFALQQEEFSAIRKIEDFALSQDQKTLFITSGFDRIKPDGSWDAWNTLLAMDVASGEVQVVRDSGIKDNPSSKELKGIFMDLLKAGHMKIEGLTTLPGNRLVFGVREIGESWKNPVYTSTFIECTYYEQNGKIMLKDDFRISYTMKTDSFMADLGLSSLNYDPVTNGIWATTSIELEEGEKLGSCIWFIPLSEYEKGGDAQILKTTKGEPIYMPHKAEGIAKMSNDNFLIIHDNDRTDVPIDVDGKQVSRQRHEALYSVVRIINVKQYSKEK